MPFSMKKCIQSTFLPWMHSFCCFASWLCPVTLMTLPPARVFLFYRLLQSHMPLSKTKSSTSLSRIFTISAIQISFPEVCVQPINFSGMAQDCQLTHFPNNYILLFNTFYPFPPILANCRESAVFGPECPASLYIFSLATQILLCYNEVKCRGYAPKTA